MRRQRKAKIIATLGPASSSYETIKALFMAGADVFRLNFSHGEHADQEERYKIIRTIEQELKRPIGVLLDLQGPKLRIGTFSNTKISCIYLNTNLKSLYFCSVAMKLGNRMLFVFCRHFQYHIEMKI